MYESDNFHDTYVSGIKEHLENYEYINTPRDCKQKEKIMYTFRLSNPVERICYTPVRKVNIIFLFAEFLWYLKGENSLDFISYYAPSMKRFSMDGKTLTGTAYGSKFRGSNSEKDVVDQLSKVIQLLQEEPDTKRAVISIYQSYELQIENNIDISCTLSIQYLIRDGKLISIVNMRANDMYIGEVSDVFSFTMLQEYIARKLNLPLGDYYHLVGSSHLYEPNWEKASLVLAKSNPYSTYNMKFPVMPSSNLDEDIEKLFEIEEKLRKNKIAITTNVLKDLFTNEYWRQLAMLLEIKRELEYDKQVVKENVEYLDEVYQYLIREKFGLSE